jgi:hypothetical protein
MNDIPRLDPAERADLARLLPPPQDPELPADRHRLLKDAFLQEITHTPPRSRRRMALFAAPAAALAVAAVLIVALTVGRPAPDGAVVSAPVVAVDPGNPAGVARLMDDIALAAAQKPQTTVGQSQFVYVRSRVAWAQFVGNSSSGPKEAGVDAMVLDAVHDREIWLPQTDGSEGLIREDGETFGLQGALPNSRYAELPTDPDALLSRIYADTKGQGESHGPDYQAFDFIGEALRESILPPRLTAAFYRAAAKIPGVVMVQDSVDAAGRHGVAVARTDNFGERREWIFDARTFDYLGERSYLVRDTDAGKAGMLTGTTAVLQRAVVDQPGDLPE